MKMHLDEDLTFHICKCLATKIDFPTSNEAPSESPLKIKSTLVSEQNSLHFQKQTSLHRNSIEEETLSHKKMFNPIHTGLFGAKLCRGGADLPPPTNNGL